MQEYVLSVFSLSLALHQQHIMKIKKKCPRFLNTYATEIKNVAKTQTTLD